MNRFSIHQPKLTPSNNKLNLAVEDYRTFRQGGMREYYRKRMQHTVASCIKLLSDKISTIPISVIDKKSREEAPRKEWMDYPNPDQTWPEFIQYAVASYLATGACYFYGVGGVAKEPEHIYVFSNDEIEVEYNEVRDVLTDEVSFIKTYRLAGSDSLPGRELNPTRVAHVRNKVISLYRQR